MAKVLCFFSTFVCEWQLAKFHAITWSKNTKKPKTTTLHTMVNFSLSVSSGTLTWCSLIALATLYIRMRAPLFIAKRFNSTAAYRGQIDNGLFFGLFTTLIAHLAAYIVRGIVGTVTASSTTTAYIVLLLLAQCILAYCVLWLLMMSNHESTSFVKEFYIGNFAITAIIGLLLNDAWVGLVHLIGTCVLNILCSLALY